MPEPNLIPAPPPPPVFKQRGSSVPPMAPAGEKTRLTLCRCYLSVNGPPRVDANKTFAAMLNPSELTHSYSIIYNKDPTLGSTAANQRFSAMGEDKVSFALLLDGTGVVPDSGTGTGAREVQQQLEDLEDIVYRYQGKQHEPSRVRIVWGSLIFYGRLESMSCKFTLFKPNGAPLRANIDLSFVGSVDRREAELLANASSPDLSHLVEVRQGDTLPLLCERIYGDPGYYCAVARFNRLTDFRDLPAGAKLHFPPLE
jgi:hypothetical protein